MFEKRGLVKKSATPATLAQPVRRQERELMDMAAKRHWSFRVLGVAPVPNAPVFHQNWWLVPIVQDTSPIPAFAMERVRAIYEAGIRPKAFLILHEAPQQLMAPKDAPKISKFEFYAHRLTEHSMAAAKLTGTILTEVVVPVLTQVVLPVGLAVLGVSAMAAVGLVSALLTDPCLIAVTEDDVWIQVAYWMA